MIFDRIYSRCCAPKKKKNNAAAWILGALAVLSLVPLAVRRDKVRGEWGFASLLLFVSCRRSAQESGKKELTVAFPGITHLRAVFHSDDALRPFKRRAVCDDACDFDDIDDDVLADLLDTEGDADPEVVISEE